MADKPTKATASRDTEYEEITVKVRKDLDPELRARALAQLGPRETVVIGNIADLQRAGAEAIAHGAADFSKGVADPPTEDDEELNPVTPAEFEASRGRTTVETEREGISPEPVATDTATAPKPKDEAKK